MRSKLVELDPYLIRVQNRSFAPEDDPNLNFSTLVRMKAREFGDKHVLSETMIQPSLHWSRVDFGLKN